MLGAANINGVPPLGLPKISNFVGGIFMPAFSASPLWSTSAKSVTPFACRIPLSFSTVWSTECLLGLLTMPLSVDGAISAPPRSQYINARSLELKSDRWSSRGQLRPGIMQWRQPAPQAANELAPGGRARRVIQGA